MTCEGDERHVRLAGDWWGCWRWAGWWCGELRGILDVRFWIDTYTEAAVPEGLMGSISAVGQTVLDGF